MTEAHEFINEPEHRHLEKSDSKERSIVKSSNTSRKGQVFNSKIILAITIFLVLKIISKHNDIFDIYIKIL